MPVQSTPQRPSVGQILAMPPQWLNMYEQFITKNAGQVSQIESALRSLTYIIPGKSDAQTVDERANNRERETNEDRPLSRCRNCFRVDSFRSPTTHHVPRQLACSRSGKTARSALDTCQIHNPLGRQEPAVQTDSNAVANELLCEMSAKRKGGEKARWRVVVMLEGVKALCRLLLLRITNSRVVVTPALPEREPIPEETDPEEEESEESLLASESEFMGGVSSEEASQLLKAPHEKEWTMPRTGMSMPSLPESGDISSYLLGRVLTADDIKPATKLLNKLQGGNQAAEILHILAPLAYAIALARSENKRSWKPWLVGLAVEYAARQLRDGSSLRATALE
ncbi:hypothetical protein Golomagni_07859, partial [Golovinomyces magnicellulatus]